MKKSIIIGLFILMCRWGISQEIKVQPIFPTQNTTIILQYDASQGNAALLGYTDSIYIHTGLITNLSTGPADWRYVLNNWTINNTNCLLTPLGNNQYQWVIPSSIRNFYNVPLSETILKLAMVFRSKDGVIVGKAAANADIFYDLCNAGFCASIIWPQQPIVYPTYGQSLILNGAASSNASLKIYFNNVLHKTEANDSIINDTLQMNFTGLQKIKFEANNGTNIIIDSILAFVTPPTIVATQPTGTHEGINYITNNKVRLSFLAPYKDHIYVVGEFNNWQLDTAYLMRRDPDGEHYWLDINNLISGQEYSYQYIIDDSIKVADYNAEKLLDPWNDIGISSQTYPNLKPYPVGQTTGIVATFQTNEPSYNWHTSNFQKPNNSNLVIYELLVRDWSNARNFQLVIDSLSYLKKLGINAIELMPINEFENNESWGYNSAYYFAVDKFYGSKNKLKELIDSCHSNGIAVLQDIALNHQFGNASMVQMYWDNQNSRPAVNSPWFNTLPKHDFNVGYDMNHDSPYTRKWVDRVLKYWAGEYKIDGWRFDLAKGFTQQNTVGNLAAWANYDASRVYNIDRMVDSIRAYFPNQIIILEMFADNNEEQHYSSRNILVWGNANCEYSQASMGYASGPCNWDFDWKVNYKTRAFSNATLVGYMESHDEERLMYKNAQFGNSSGNYNIKDLNTSLKRQALAAAFLIPIPGPKMIFQFGELGYDISIDYNGRTGIKPNRWSYTIVPERVELLEYYKALIALKKLPAFSSTNFYANESAAIKRIQIDHSSMNVIIIGNFGVTSAIANPNFQHAGTWYDYFAHSNYNFTTTNPSITLQPGQFIIYTDQPLAAPYFTGNTASSIVANSTFNLFPNPASTTVYIDNITDMNTKISIQNINGQTVQTATIINGSAMLSVNSLADGIYIVKLTNERETITKKIFVKK
jgi:1,4-alpha-glucan branching enzyme